MSKHAHIVLALVAVAVAGTSARSADDAKDDAAKRFKESLQGKWQMTSRIDEGVASDAELVKNRTVVFEGDKYTVRDGDKVLAELSYTIDAAKKPAWLDVTPKEGESAKGIIKLEGDTLTFCVGKDGTRPSDFKSEKDSGRLLAEFKKVKK